VLRNADQTLRLCQLLEYTTFGRLDFEEAYQYRMILERAGELWRGHFRALDPAALTGITRPVFAQRRTDRAPASKGLG